MIKYHIFEKPAKILWLGIMIFLPALMVFGVAFYLYLIHDLPSIEALKHYKPPIISKFYSDDGEVIGEYFSEKRELVSLEAIPHNLIQAFIAGEDAKFFQHKGLDYIAILRAFLRNIFSGEMIQGGSTITQQVVKSLLLSPKKSFLRKIREAVLAFKIEKYLSKEEILYLYLNQIYMGHGAYGVAAASENYFGKPIEELNLAESALLAGLPQAPSKNSPYLHPEQSRKRQTYILERMAQEGFISHDQLMRALWTPIKIREKQNSFIEKAPHFVEHVKKYIEEKYGKDVLHKNGLQVHTTIDNHFQRIAQEAVESGLKEIEKRQKYVSMEIPLPLEGAMICFDLETGYVKAMVGGRNFKKSQFNRVTQSRRQTGSAFKPIVYASALDKGYTPASVIVDSPIVFKWGDKTWKPKNFEEKFLGPITLRKALVRSVNVVTVKIAQDIGLDYLKDYAKKMGISSPLQNNLSMALGSSGLSLYELTKAYSIFANQGNSFEPILIKKILDRDGNLLEENLSTFYFEGSSNEKRILNPQTAYLMTNLMENVVQDGTGWKAKSLRRPVAAKTGTTDQFMDAWFIGYTPELITGVWVGFDEEKSLGNNETGARAASPIWVNFMLKVLDSKPIKHFPIPEGIEFMRIESVTDQTNLKGETTFEYSKEGIGPRPKGFPQTKTAADFFKFDFNLSTKPK